MNSTQGYHPPAIEYTEENREYLNIDKLNVCQESLLNPNEQIRNEVNQFFLFQ